MIPRGVPLGLANGPLWLRDCGVEFYIDDDGLSVGADIFGPDGELVDRVERVMTSSAPIEMESMASRLPYLHVVLAVKLALRVRPGEEHR
jgi:hypothetical protein